MLPQLPVSCRHGFYFGNSTDYAYINTFLIMQSSSEKGIISIVFFVNLVNCHLTFLRKILSISISSRKLFLKSVGRKGKNMTEGLHT